MPPKSAEDVQQKIQRLQEQQKQLEAHVKAAEADLAQVDLLQAESRRQVCIAKELLENTKKELEALRKRKPIAGSKDQRKPDDDDEDGNDGDDGGAGAGNQPPAANEDETPQPGPSKSAATDQSTRRSARVSGRARKTPNRQSENDVAEDTATLPNRKRKASADPVMDAASSGRHTKAKRRAAADEPTDAAHADDESNENDEADKVDEVDEDVSASENSSRKTASPAAKKTTSKRIRDQKTTKRQQPSGQFNTIDGLEWTSSGALPGLDYLSRPSTIIRDSRVPPAVFWSIGCPWCPEDAEDNTLQRNRSFGKGSNNNPWFKGIVGMKQHFKIHKTRMQNQSNTPLDIFNLCDRRKLRPAQVIGFANDPASLPGVKCGSQDI